MELFKSLEARTKSFNDPFKHFEINQPLTNEAIKEISDANIADPLAQFELKSEDFYEITKRTLLATNKYNNKKVVSILEGGYDLNALAESADEHVKALQQNK